MDFIKRDDIKKNALPGRVVQNAVGHNSAVLSEKMTVSFFAITPPKAVPWSPTTTPRNRWWCCPCKDAYVKWGSGKDSLEHTVELHEGDLMHFPPWSGTCSATKRAAIWTPCASTAR